MDEIKALLIEERTVPFLTSQLGITADNVRNTLDAIEALGYLEQRFEGEWRYKLRAVPITHQNIRERLLPIVDDFCNILGKMPTRAGDEKGFHLYVLRSVAHKSMIAALDALTALEHFSK